MKSRKPMTNKTHAVDSDAVNADAVGSSTSIASASKTSRLDQLLVSLGLAKSRAQAQTWIKQGQVFVRQQRWVKATKPSVSYLFDQRMPVAEQIRIETTELDRFVSRAGFKLDQAFKRVLEATQTLAGTVALDIGQSTGGFTDALLQRGCQRVVGVEVGHNQLDRRLASDTRVQTFEGVNARNLSGCGLTQSAPEGFDWLVMDVSFISQRLLWDELPPYLKPGGFALSLVKPQFELGSKALGKGGIVKNEAALAQIQHLFTDFFSDKPLEVLDFFESPILGGDGNKEYFIYLKKKPLLAASV
jgi:23S rRNA (cytidine1920-2'-O)/16S rRNA (cytidine1409-2'-O)-methyltransferase